MLKASKYEAGHKIRFLRVVVDYDVDRMQVYRWRHQSRALLIARSLSLYVGWCIPLVFTTELNYDNSLSICQPYSGGYSVRVPPLPIPNREVKPHHADGTA